MILSNDAIHISFVLNGQPVELDIPPNHTLADVLRDRLGMTGTHLGCEHGVCGACTVLLDDDPVRSCLLFAVQADDASVRTVEGMGGPEGKLAALQEEFGARGGLQCGFCTPGFLVLADALLEREPDASDERITEVMSSNLCRCTGYTGIVDAVRAMRDERSDDDVD